MYQLVFGYFNAPLASTIQGCLFIGDLTHAPQQGTLHKRAGQVSELMSRREPRDVLT